jgi:hypothetical protein
VGSSSPIETATAATCFDQTPKSTPLLPSTLSSPRTLHEILIPTQKLANMAGDPRALLRQVGRTLESQPIGKSLISRRCNRQNSLYRKLPEVSASLAGDKINVQSAVTLQKLSLLTHVTDEAAADQFVAAANAFRMQKMGTKRRIVSDSKMFASALICATLTQRRQGSR